MKIAHSITFETEFVEDKIPTELRLTFESLNKEQLEDYCNKAFRAIFTDNNLKLLNSGSTWAILKVKEEANAELGC